MAKLRAHQQTQLYLGKPIKQKINNPNAIAKLGLGLALVINVYDNFGFPGVWLVAISAGRSTVVHNRVSGAVADQTPGNPEQNTLLSCALRTSTKDYFITLSYPTNPHMPINKSITSKLPQVGTTIFSIMSKLATEHKAINLSQGFPDFDCHPELLELVNKYLHAGNNQYAPMQGVLPLRNILAEKTASLYGAKYNPDTEITITAGATQAIYTAITAIIKPGDEVIVFDPAYDSYEPAIALNGGITIHLRLQAPSYEIDWASVKDSINARTKMIIINTPHNPTGTVLSATDMLMLTEVIKDTNIVIISDELYEHIIFDQQPHYSVARFRELAERSFIISSFGKTFHATGWKVGYCVAPAYLMAEFWKVHQFLVFSVNTPVQLALAEFLAEPRHYTELGDFYQQKRDYFISLLKPSKFELTPAAGTYFQLLNYKKLSQEKDTDYALQLIKEFGVASIPISVFYQNEEQNQVLRFCFAKKPETLEKAAALLNAL